MSPRTRSPCAIAALATASKRARPSSMLQLVLRLEKLSLVGDPFDPQYAEAVALVPVENPELHNVVLAEMRTGFSLNGVVLRPAQVRVGSHQG